MAGAPRPFEPAVLSAEDWEAVFQQTLSFAEYQVARLSWRHKFGGILPGGFDPSSIAAQAIMSSSSNPQVISSMSAIPFAEALRAILLSSACRAEVRRRRG